MIHISRMIKAYQKHGEAFLHRIFVQAELDDCLNKGVLTPAAAASLAARFAAKEAMSKALGTGIGSQCGWQDLVIQLNERGAPVPILKQAAWQRYQILGGLSIAISLSHDQDIAQAFCVILCSDQIEPDEVNS